ncbi:hypothetical protein [Paenibacillus campi]|uniref:hypothetical protein n=1 Tax=Paenibacillus campi TaxID=3106031 RepID=UPI002AFF0957|nr:hypothetical protein [Paenibacillus sp. SGZ-1009]
MHYFERKVGVIIKHDAKNILPPAKIDVPVEHIQIVLDGMVKSLLNESSKGATVTRMIAELYNCCLELIISEHNIEVVVYQIETRELAAYAKYDLYSKKIMYTLQNETVNKCMADLIMLHELDKL